MLNTELRDRILNASTISTTNILSESIIYDIRNCISTDIPMINVALSGRVNGGLLPGLLQICGESKHFKTGFTLLLASSFLKKYPDSILIFYDSEFGTTKSYFNSFDIDPEHIIHCPITNIEELRFDIMAQLKNLNSLDHVMIFVDSIGNLASLKEIDDAEKQKSVEDMTRAKKLKSLFRMITPHLTLKNIPMIVVNHIYQTMDLYPTNIVGGGKGSYLSSNDIWIIGRQQEKDSDKNLEGFNFIINIEKSRTIKEKSKIPITVTWKEGILKYSGVFDLALEGGFIVKSNKSRYSIPGIEDTTYSRNDLEYNEEFWKQMLSTTKLNEFIQDKYLLPESSLIKKEEV